MLDGDGREGHGSEARLVASSPASLAGALEPLVDASAPNERGWPFQEVLRTRQPVCVDDLARRFGALPGGRYGVTPEKAVVFPLFRDDQDRYGFIVLGLGPWRAASDPYLGFLGLVAGQLASAIARARASEEERLRAEAMEELDRAKTLFFSDISHELRTPLTLMLGPTRDALLSPGRALEGRDLEVVHRNALRLQKLVGSLLDFARIEAGRARASFEPVRLDVLTADLASTFESAMRDAGLAYEVHCDELREPILTDPDMWEKILLNLISNAFKFTFEGRVRVSLVARGDRVELEVADTGTGIPEHELPHVFDRFHRVEGARARTQEGSGIGLALAHELARILGGNVSAKSTAGVGTTMTVVIPARKAGPSYRGRSAAPERTHAAATASSSKKRSDGCRGARRGPSPLPRRPAPRGRWTELPLTARILVVDDNADMRDYLARVLVRQLDGGDGRRRRSGPRLGPRAPSGRDPHGRHDAEPRRLRPRREVARRRSDGRHPGDHAVRARRRGIAHRGAARWRGRLSRQAVLRARAGRARAGAPHPGPAPPQAPRARCRGAPGGGGRDARQGRVPRHARARAPQPPVADRDGRAADDSTRPELERATDHRSPAEAAGAAGGRSARRLADHSREDRAPQRANLDRRRREARGRDHAAALRA